MTAITLAGDGKPNRRPQKVTDACSAAIAIRSPRSDNQQTRCQPQTGFWETEVFLSGSTVNRNSCGYDWQIAITRLPRLLITLTGGKDISIPFPGKRFHFLVHAEAFCVLIVGIKTPVTAHRMTNSVVTFPMRRSIPQKILESSGDLSSIADAWMARLVYS